LFNNFVPRRSGIRTNSAAKKGGDLLLVCVSRKRHTKVLSNPSDNFTFVWPIGFYGIQQELEADRPVVKC